VANAHSVGPGWQALTVKDTWASRDLPVLDATVELVDEMYASSRYPEGDDIAKHAGMDIQSVGAALNALDGEFIELQRTGDFGRWGIPRITTAARRAVGQRPTAEAIIDRLAAGMTQAAERESDPERRRRLSVARELGGVAKAVAVNVVSEILEHRLPR
jgi:hypothetical protein